MRRRRQNSLLALLALLLAAFAPAEVESARVGGFEGAGVRVNAVHGLCPTFELEYEASSRHAPAAAVCRLDNGCTLDETFFPAHWTEANRISVPLSPPAQLLTGEAAGVVALIELPARFADLRGLTLPSGGTRPRVAVDPPSLRAPPAA